MPAAHLAAPRYAGMLTQPRSATAAAPPRSHRNPERLPAPARSPFPPNPPPLPHTRRNPRPGAGARCQHLQSPRAPTTPGTFPLPPQGTRPPGAGRRCPSRRRAGPHSRHARRGRSEGGYVGGGKEDGRVRAHPAAAASHSQALPIPTRRGNRRAAEPL